MGRQGGMIRPSERVYEVAGGAPEGEAEVYLSLTVSGSSVQVWMETPDLAAPPLGFVLDPEMAPLFRMVANRLDELAGKRRPKEVS